MWEGSILIRHFGGARSAAEHVNDDLFGICKSFGNVLVRDVANRPQRINGNGPGPGGWRDEVAEMGLSRENDFSFVLKNHLPNFIG